MRSTSWETGYGHTEKSARLLCSLLLVFFSIVQLFARSQWNSILCQWTLTRLDPWIELQTIKEKKDFQHNNLEMFMFKQRWSHLLHFFNMLNKSYQIEIKNVISVSLVWPKTNLHNTINQMTRLYYCINFKTLELIFTPSRFLGTYPSLSSSRAHHHSVSLSSWRRRIVMASPSLNDSSSGFWALYSHRVYTVPLFITPNFSWTPAWQKGCILQYVCWFARMNINTPLKWLTVSYRTETGNTGCSPLPFPHIYLQQSQHH